MFDRLLIANRGEIACRIMATARELGITTIAVYSGADRDAMHVRTADEAHEIGPPPAAESYLDIDTIVQTAQETGADAIHPGYGFLAENPDFPTAVSEAGLTFVGPEAEVIEAMGVKDRAKDLMEEAGVPVVPGYRGENQDPEHLQKQAEEIGFPVLIKPRSGGGGKGMRLVESPESFQDELAASRREAKKAFGDESVLLEKFITRPRHVEVQVFGDHHGNAVHVFERDCSLQRRYQKVIEEAPAPGVPQSFREKIGNAAVRAVESLDYTNAGTMEFIVDASGDLSDADFYFMEMNTRLQVEHPVTEMVTGEDLVEWQLRVANGEELPRKQDEIQMDGHAFEARLYAEDPSEEFAPRTGRIQRFVQPEPSKHLRIDAGVEDGDRVSIHYDPMIAKIIVWGPNRSRAVRRMHQALLDTGVAGMTTNQEFLLRVFEQQAFQNGDVHTRFIPEHRDELIPPDYGTPRRPDLLLAAVHYLSGGETTDAGNDAVPSDPWWTGTNWRLNGVLETSLTIQSDDTETDVSATCHDRQYTLSINGDTTTVALESYENGLLELRRDGARVTGRIFPTGSEGDIILFRRGRCLPFHLYVPGREPGEIAGAGRVRASMPGTIIEVLVAEGDEVEQNQPVLKMEAMKMEMTIEAGRGGTVQELPVSVGDQVSEDDLLISIEENDKS